VGALPPFLMTRARTYHSGARPLYRQARDERGQSLLALAAEHNHLEVRGLRRMVVERTGVWCLPFTR
jgi:hypothetical protein